MDISWTFKRLPNFQMCVYGIGLASKWKFSKTLSWPIRRIQKIVTVVGLHSSSTCLRIPRSQSYGGPRLTCSLSCSKEFFMTSFEEEAISPNSKPPVKLAHAHPEIHPLCSDLHLIEPWPAWRGTYMVVSGWRGIVWTQERQKLLCSTSRYRPRWSPAKGENHLDPQGAARLFLEKDCRSEHKANWEGNMWIPGSFLRSVWKGKHGTSPIGFPRNFSLPMILS